MKKYAPPKVDNSDVTTEVSESNNTQCSESMEKCKD